MYPEAVPYARLITSTAAGPKSGRELNDHTPFGSTGETLGRGQTFVAASNGNIPFVDTVGGGSMGLRYATAVLGAVLLASVTIFSSTMVEPQRAGATTTVTTCSGGSITLRFKEKRTLVLHNKARTDHGLKPLCVNRKLTRAARSHSREMIGKDYFSHYSYDGEGVGSRLKRFGYDGSVYDENIAGGYGTSGEPDPIFRLWMNDPPHRANILDRRFRQVGVGTYKGSYKGKDGYTMYTVDFGSRS